MATSTDLQRTFCPLKSFSYQTYFLMLIFFAVGSMLILMQWQFPVSTKSGSGWQKKWIIADVRTGYCEHLQPPPGWTVLSVEDILKTTPTDLPKNKSPHEVEHLSFLQNASQESRYAWRKNVAYLTAIAVGTTQILETDCSVSLTRVLSGMRVKGQRDHGLMYNDTLLFNPYAHFGAWALAPWAALHTGGWNNSRLYYVRHFKKVLIKHAVSDQSEDAKVLLHKKDAHGESVGMKFDRSFPPAYLGQRSFSPAVPVCSVYQREAFWALLNPCLSFRPHCPVLRLFIQQRLLRELDAFSGYYQTGSLDFHKALSALNKMTYSPNAMNLTALAFFLDRWTCAAKLSFYTCYKNLVHDLGSEGFVSQLEKMMMTIWIAALEKLGVENVDRRPTWQGRRKLSEVRMTLGSVQARLERGGSEEQRLSRLFIEPVVNCCRHSSSSARVSLNISLWKTPMIDMVLIVVFNSVDYFWSNLPFLETLYRPFFKHIVYCVSDMDQLVRKDQHGALRHVVLLEGFGLDGWSLFYGCVAQVVEMEIPGVEGYVQIGDDALLNTWMFLNGPHDTVLVHERGQLRQINEQSVNWVHWAAGYGRCAIVRALAGLEQLSGLDKAQLLKQNVRTNESFQMTFTEVLLADHLKDESPKNCYPMLPGSQDWQKPTQDQARRFLLNYYHVHGMAGKVRVNGQDFIYIPQTVATDYVDIAHHFMKNRVMVELAVYNIELGLTGLGQMKNVSGFNSWTSDREKSPERRYNTSHHYMHPFKLSRLPTNAHNARFFCDVHLQNLFSKIVEGKGKN